MYTKNKNKKLKENKPKCQQWLSLEIERWVWFTESTSLYFPVYVLLA